MDGLRLRASSLSTAADNAAGSGTESEVSVEEGSEQIHLGHQMDMTVLLLRESFGMCFALPVAWLQLHPTVSSLREHKLRRIESGVETILKIQSYRNPVLDLVMQVFSFCAEEEFYLILLPIMFWNGYYEVASRLTMIVVCGLLMGNTVKDIFELPRPGARVWHPALNLDSTHLQDFGFPSTHAMNAVTNSLLLAEYFSMQEVRIAKLPAFALALVYIFMLSLSRMYLGAHTGTDVRGGLGLGVLVFCQYLLLRNEFEEAWMDCSMFAAITWSILLSATVLLLCPQPRPITPTFQQNALLVGLCMGLFLGKKMAFDLDLMEDMPGGWKFTLFGFASMLAVRQIAKLVIVLVLEQVFGVRTKATDEVLKRRAAVKRVSSPSSQANEKRQQQPQQRRRRRRVVRLFTRDVDIIAGAVVKVVTYTSAALWITVGNRYCWEWLQAQSYFK